MKESFVGDIRELLGYCSPQVRSQLLFVFAMMLLGALAELASVGSIVPFLAIVGSPSTAGSNPILGPIVAALGLTTPYSVVVFATLTFAVAALCATFMRIALTWASQRFVFGVAQEISVALFSRTLHQPYTYHVAHNSSEIIAAVNKAQVATGGLLMPLMQAAIAAVISAFILLGLLVIDPVTALATGLGFSLIYLSVMRLSRITVRRNGAIIAKGYNQRIQAIAEAVGGIRDVLLDHNQATFIARFEASELRVRQAQAVSALIGMVPRYVVEGIGLTLVALITLVLSLRDGGLLAALPVLGALALGAQRLLPLLQQMYVGWVAGTSSQALLRDVLEILRQPQAAHYLTTEAVDHLPFDRAIAIQKVSYHYPNSHKSVLHGVTVTIPKGARVGIVGKTGSGKTTLMDLVLGLLSPTSGQILIDDIELTDNTRQAWQAQISHVPQAIFLSDGTIAENIAFGIRPDDIDRERLVHVARQAELDEVIATLPDGFDTLVGERGIRLSGGQRQRIGIARALYRRAKVLILDEATSALDHETESAVMKGIEKLDSDLTILMIAHRLTTIERCDFIVRLSNGVATIERSPALGLQSSSS